ncbi:FH1/FH2 domain-containing protein 3-like isoform X4 [Littorina saxatilis]|uniref:FH1/FH2 domain-containing protein 3-like isoform X4 n=1 Tax=Littorina saxatilis TaxID=31220 RepID=UPI0038B56BEC
MRRSSSRDSLRYREPSYDRYGGISSGRPTSYGSKYDMGTGKHYGSGSSYGGYGGSSSYKPPAAPSYGRSYSHDAATKYGGAAGSGGASVLDKAKKFSGSSMDSKYGGHSTGTDYRYPSLDRSTLGKDRYSSLDRYSTRSSDYGGGGGGGGGGTGTPYSSWDRASSRYGAGSRDASPVSSKSSRYDYSSSASPYSTYSSYKSGSDASPVPKRTYDRGSDYNSGRRPSTDSRYSGGLAPPPPAVSRQSSTSSRRKTSVSDESDDSAPEAEKRDASKYLVCRGTSPPPDPEAPKRENKAQERISVSRTRRIKVPDRSQEKPRSRRQTVIEKRPLLTDIATQVNLDQPQNRRSRPSSSSQFGERGGGGGGGGERDRRRDKYGAPSSNTPSEKSSWRQAVYGEPPPPSSSRGSSRRPADDEVTLVNKKQVDSDDDDDYSSSRQGRRRRGDSRTKAPSRSNSREDVLDDKPARRKRHSSKELLDDDPKLTPENLSLRESIEKMGRTNKIPGLEVKKWRQHLPHGADPAGGITRSDSYEYLSASDVIPPQREGGHSRNSRHDSPDHSRDTSPSRRSRRHGGTRKQPSRSASNDSLLDAADDDPRLLNKDFRGKGEPNKDFRKSELNKNRYYHPDPDVFSREQSPEPPVHRSRGHRRNDSHGKDSQSGSQRGKQSGSTSDQASSHAFSRDESPNRNRHSRGFNRENSRDSMLDERRRDDRDDSPGRHRNANRRSRHGSREDVLDDRGSNSNRQSGEYRKRPSQLAVEKSYDESGKYGKMAPSGSQHSLPDIVNDASPRDAKQQQQEQMPGYISRMQDIDSILEEERYRPRNQKHIMDAPVPPNCHNPLKPSPVSSPTPGRPNSYAFETSSPRSGNNSMRPSKSLGDKLLDGEDEQPRRQRAPPPVNSPPPPSSTSSASPGGKRNKVKLSTTAQQMWGILQSKKGLVTISDFLSLCEKTIPQRKLIQVGGAESEDSYKPFNNSSEMLEYLGVDVQKLEDCALQIYRYHSGGAQAEFGTYLDLESALDEQAEELEGFSDQRKNTLILRTQLTVRVHAIIEKLLNSSGRELRRALFSLKQIFQDDKDLVHEFVNNDGLDCLIKVGAEADQNYQNYILRALGQVMLYVDGMEGVIRHNATIQWLYTLLASKGRLVVKTALKLLLVFVEYTDNNATQLLRAINTVDARRGLKPWANIMAILSEKDGADSELLVYAMTLVNKVLNAIPEQDIFYDVADALEEQGMDRITQRHMERQGADLDLLTQFQIYEGALKHEDGEDFSAIPQLENLRQVPRLKSEGETGRKSKRHAPQKKNHQRIPEIPTESPAEAFRKQRDKHTEKNTVPSGEQVFQKGIVRKQKPEEFQNGSSTRFIEVEEVREVEEVEEDDNTSVSVADESSQAVFEEDYNACTEEEEITLLDEDEGPRVRRERKSRVERQCSLIKEQELNKALQRPLGIEPPADLGSTASSTSSLSSPPGTLSSTSSAPLQAVLSPRLQKHVPPPSSSPTPSSPSDLESSEGLIGNGKGPPQRYNESGYHSFAEASLVDPNSFETRQNAINSPRRQPEDDGSMSSNQRWAQKQKEHKDHDRFEPPAPPVHNHRQDGGLSPRVDQYHEEEQASPRVSQKEKLNIEGSVKDAVKNLAFNKDRGELPIKMQLPSGDSSGLIGAAKDGLSRSSHPEPRETLPPPEPEKKTESDMQWERIQRRLKRQLKIKDMDFTDLQDDEDIDVFAPVPMSFDMLGGMPPPPPPGMPGMPPPPPPMGMGMGPPPPPPMGGPPPPPCLPGMGPAPPPCNLPPPPGSNLPKKKKTVKLHWKPLQSVEQPHPATKGDLVWKELVPVHLDVEKLEHLFETRTNEVKQKLQDTSGKKEITVLDTKRSNAINIGLTVLPPPRTIKAAILKMDTSIMNKEGIEKILQTMIPTEEEKAKILEAQMANPDIPLGTAEQFLLTLSSVFELEARLHLWLFKLDYETLEQEVAEPLMDLKKGLEELHSNKTFRCILSAVLAIGNFLNGTSARAFSISFLQRVPEVKDTVHKHSLLYHLCTMIIEQFKDTTDLYSEIGPITRCSRIDWEETTKKLDKMEYECKASWDHLRAILKHDGSSTDLKGKMSLFLADAAERIMLLQIIHRRVWNRYRKLLLYMGLPMHEAKDMKINQFCKVVSEFALEYRTTRDKVLHMIEKKANQRERKKTRGKMINETENFVRSNKQDEQLHNLLKNGYTSADESRFPGQKSRRRKDAFSLGTSSRGGMTTDSEMYDTGDDEILEACVRTAATPINKPNRERRRSRSQRKSSISSLYSDR